MLFTSTNIKAHQFAPSLIRFVSKAYKVVLAAVVVLSLFTGINGCSGKLIESIKDTSQKVSKTVQQVKSFQSILIDKYQEKEIGVGINYNSTERETTRVISVVFANTQFNKLTANKREMIARDVAKLAKDYFTLNQPSDFISVSFTEGRNWGMIEYSRLIDSYTIPSSEVTTILPSFPPTQTNE